MWLPTVAMHAGGGLMCIPPMSQQYWSLARSGLGHLVLIRGGVIEVHEPQTGEVASLSLGVVAASVG